MNPREFQLLLYCARSRPDAGLVRDAVNNRMHWPTLLQLAQQHGVRPLLLQSLKSACWEAAPQAIRLELERFNRENTQKNMSLTAELLRLLEAFQRSGIPIAAFKGPTLAESVYGDLSLREFCDLDVLVHEADLRRAEHLLTACGYRDFFGDRDYRAAFLSYQCQYPFRHTETGIVLDLHWRLASKGIAFPLRTSEAWAGLSQAKICGRTVPTFGQNDLALFLAGHGTKEGWRSLIWLCDFAELLSEFQDIDWAEVLYRACRAHSSRPLLLAITLASRLLNAPAPAELLEKARNDSAVQTLAEEAQRRMLQDNPPEELGSFFAGLKTHDRLRHRLWPVVTLLTTRTVGDHKALPLPRSLWGVYYFTRPFRLAGKAAKLALRRTGRRRQSSEPSKVSGTQNRNHSVEKPSVRV